MTLNEQQKYPYRAPGSDVQSLKEALVYKLIFGLGCPPSEATKTNWLNAALLAVRDLAAERWLQTTLHLHRDHLRRPRLRGQHPHVVPQRRQIHGFPQRTHHTPHNK